jgi:type IV secretory pathway TraG/TraD family ATPase VirD4
MSPRYENILDRVMTSLTETDHLRFRQMSGTLVVGDPGSGKSSALGKHFFCAFARAGCGALCHAIKSDDAETFITWARECGREHDVVVFSEASGLRFDPLAYEWTRAGVRGGGDAESIISYFSTLLTLSHPQSGGSGERFWELAAEQAMRHAIKLIQLAGEPLSIVNVHRAISSFPDRLGQQDEQGWEERSYTASLINAIRARKDSLSETQWQDLETASEFIFYRWADLDPRPRSSIVMTFAGTADKFLFHPLRHIFASGAYDFTPEQITHEQKILIIDFPVLEYGKETARLINVMIQLTCQRAWLRHQYKPGCCNGAFLYMDEFQLLMHRFQNHFVQVSRSSGVCVIALTQTLLNLAEELGETHLGAKTKAFLANLGIKIALRSTCPDTCNYYSDVIGKAYTYMPNYNAGSSGDSGQGHTSFGGSRQLVYQVEPYEFSGLARPDGQNPFAEAIVFCGGDHFNATRTGNCPQGRNHLRVHFSRD